MTSLDLALDIVQFAALFVLSITNGLIAYSVFKIQKDRNTPKLVVYMELVEEEDREYAGLYIQNVGLVPALNVRIVADIEEWKEGQPVRSRFHERYEAFEDHHVTLKRQDHRLYELPWMDEWMDGWMDGWMVVDCCYGCLLQQRAKRQYVLCFGR